MVFNVGTVAVIVVVQSNVGVAAGPVHVFEFVQDIIEILRFIREGFFDDGILPNAHGIVRVPFNGFSSDIQIAPARLALALKTIGENPGLSDGRGSKKDRKPSAPGAQKALRLRQYGIPVFSKSL